MGLCYNMEAYRCYQLNMGTGYSLAAPATVMQTNFQKATVMNHGKAEK